MAIGDTVQAGLMRVDFSPFLEAGRANAAANASFGQALGQVAKGYIEGQEKKKRANEIAGFLMGQGVSEKDAQAIAKNPFLQKEYQRGQEAKAKMKMERERLATQANIAAQGRAARQGELDQKYEREDADTQRLIGFSEDLISQTTDPAVVQNADMARPGLFALGGDPEMRNRFLDAEIERQPKVTVGSLGSEDFATVARETGMDPRLSANRFMGLQKIEEEEELAKQPKAPDPQVQIKNENDLRKEFNSLPEVKDFNKVRTSYDKVVLAGENPSAAGDISMIFNYMKILDPGSVVREGEFATAQNAAGVPQRVINQYNKIVKGERLSEDQRSDFMNQARFAAEAQFKPVSEQMTRYQGVARNMGLRLDQVLPTSFLTMGEQLGQEFKTKPDLNSNAIKTDQGDYSIEGLSVEAQ